MTYNGFEIEESGNDLLLWGHGKLILIDNGYRELEKRAIRECTRAVQGYDDEGNSETDFSYDSTEVREIIEGNLVEYVKEHFNSGITINQ